MKAWLSLAAAALVGLAGAARAEAYPHWQFSSGTARCASCHLSPTGGGLLSDYGRDQAGEELSTFSGDGALLHGVGRRVPAWLALGGDLRGAFVAHDVQDPGGPAVAVFPMQAELSARLSLPLSLSLSGSLGLRGQVRRSDEQVPEQNFQPVDSSRLVSREHFIMWRPSSRGTYVKVGRFYAPFGLRLAEHIFYVRRDLGFNLMEESYNVSVGWLGGRSEVHATAFAPDGLRHMGGTTWGGAISYERQLASKSGALGAQAKVAAGDGVTRWIAGGVAKKYLPGLSTLLLAEADSVLNDFAAAHVGQTWQVVGIAGASWLPARGTILTLYAEAAHHDLRVADAGWGATSLQATWFPYPHIELQALGRLQLPAGGELARTLFVQVHYFL